MLGYDHPTGFQLSPLSICISLLSYFMRGEIASIPVLIMKIFISSPDFLGSLNRYCANFLIFTKERGMLLLCNHLQCGTGHEMRFKIMVWFAFRFMYWMWYQRWPCGDFKFCPYSQFNAALFRAMIFDHEAFIWLFAITISRHELGGYIICSDGIDCFLYLYRHATRCSPFSFVPSWMIHSRIVTNLLVCSFSLCFQYNEILRTSWMWVPSGNLKWHWKILQFCWMLQIHFILSMLATECFCWNHWIRTEHLRHRRMSPYVSVCSPITMWRSHFYHLSSDQYDDTRNPEADSDIPSFFSKSLGKIWSGIFHNNEVDCYFVCTDSFVHPLELEIIWGLALLPGTFVNMIHSLSSPSMVPSIEGLFVLMSNRWD